MQAEGAKIPERGDDDLLAAFSANAPVDKSTNFPPPNRSNVTSPDISSRGRSPAADQRPQTTSKPTSMDFEEDDDPFGLSQLTARKPPTTATQSVNDDDDILGDLGKPVEETLAARRRKEDAQRAEVERKVVSTASKEDKALAELLDMGFDIEKARRALAQTPTGDDVQAAISIILNEAHGKPSGSDRGQSQSARRGQSSETRRQRPSAQNDHEPAAWMRNGQTPSRSSAASPNGEDREISQYASEIGASVWKSANTFWKAGQKRMAKAVADFQQEGDPNQPKWMRDSSEPTARESPLPPRQSQQPGGSNRTAEANLLDAGAPPQRQKAVPLQRDPRPSSAREARPPESRQSDVDRSNRQQQMPQRPASQQHSRPAEKMNRRFVEEESAQAYVSPARRKKAEPKPAPPPEPTETLDIFSDTPPPAAPATTAPKSSTVTARPKTTSAPIKSRPEAPPRKTPPVSDDVLKASRSQRNAGGASFKQGDYGTAHSNYTNALNGIPKEHPLLIVIYCNRALTSLKVGDAKGAISDADNALTLIGPSRGEGESIDLSDEGSKSMREFFGKALLRKAEAYEHLEKWKDAAEVWQEAVQAGVGGALAIQGRNRCEKAAAPAKAPTAVPIKTKTAAAIRPKPRASALADLNGNAEGEAVRRLREQTAAAAAASDEAFALTDSVDAKLTAWKSGKAENLRGLLASLDTVLWPEAGWNKVGMGDLVLPNRVKIVYMKAIAKVHPDKVNIFSNSMID